MKRVFAITELTENILSFVPARDLFTTVPLVNKAFQAATDAPAVRRARFLLAEAPSPETTASFRLLLNHANPGATAAATPTNPAAVQNLNDYLSQATPCALSKGRLTTGTSPTAGLLINNSHIPLHPNPLLLEPSSPSALEAFEAGGEWYWSRTLSTPPLPRPSPHPARDNLLLTQPPATRVLVVAEALWANTTREDGDEQVVVFAVRASLQDPTGVRIGQVLEFAADVQRQLRECEGGPPEVAKGVEERVVVSVVGPLGL